MQNENTDWTSLTMLTTVITIIFSVPEPSLAMSLVHQGPSHKTMDEQLSEARGQITKLGQFQEKTNETNYPDLKPYSGNGTEKREWIQSQWQPECGGPPPQEPCEPKKTEPPKPEPRKPPKYESPQGSEPPRKETSDEKLG